MRKRRNANKSFIGKVIRHLNAKIKKQDWSTQNINRLRENGAIIGDNVKMYSSPFASEPYLVDMRDNTTVSSEVMCLTPDNAIIHQAAGKTDLFGKIIIGKNCFIGYRILIMYRVTIGDNCIVGAGSVVTKSVPNNKVVARNPARIICTVEEYIQKYRDKVVDWSSVEIKHTFFSEHPETLIRK